MNFNTNVIILYMLFYVWLFFRLQMHKSWLKAWILESDNPGFKFPYPQANHITSTILSLSFLIYKMGLMQGIRASQALGISSSAHISRCYLMLVFCFVLF